jgi:hypothetical protein
MKTVKQPTHLQPMGKAVAKKDKGVAKKSKVMKQPTHVEPIDKGVAKR